MNLLTTNNSQTAYIIGGDEYQVETIESIITYPDEPSILHIFFKDGDRLSYDLADRK